MKRKNKTVIIVAALAVVVAGVVGWMYVASNRANTVAPQASQVISGRVTEISNECRFDGTCSVTLDGSRSIVTGCGLMANGKTCKGYDQSKLYIGQQVQATVVKSQPGWYSLECDSCTIRVINN